MQSVQNSAIHLLKKRGNKLNTPTEELLRELHWLPIQKRIIFKVLLLVHKCLLGKAPELLMELLYQGGSTRTKKLEEPRYVGTFGERSFAVAAPKLWNCLPADLRTEEDTDLFKKKLKTFLFKNDIE